MSVSGDDNWAARYERSDHHIDRQVRKLLGMEYSSPYRHTRCSEPRENTKPPAMAWGKGRSTNVVQVTTRGRRAYSVPVEESTYIPRHHASVDRAMNLRADMDSASAASRRQDQRLLSDINNRLYNRDTYGSTYASAPTRSFSHVTAGRPPRPPSTSTAAAAAARYAEIEARIESQVAAPIPSPTSYSDLRSRANRARNYMDQHKTLLDRYLPIYMGPEPEVKYEVAHKFGELVDRMPYLLPRQPRDSRASSLPPPRQSTVTPVVRANDYSRSIRNSYAPPVSDTRKRARQILCKVKGDPRYFDY